MDARWYWRDDLDGFDLDVVGFDCADELRDEWNEAPDKFKWHCPFKPGCGARLARECPLMKRRKLILMAPDAKQ